MDKRWMQKSRASNEYLLGLNQFLDSAFHQASRNDMILCPCKNCCNRFWAIREEVYNHLVCFGFLTGYTHWVLHGEGSSSHPNVNNESTQEQSSEYHAMGSLLRNVLMGEQPYTRRDDEPNATASIFFKLIEKGQKEVYPGCKTHTLLSFLLRMFNIKCLGKWTNKSFTMMLELLKEVLPEGEILPKSFYETKKFLGDLGMRYEKIHACPNDCVLFRKEFANESQCPVCGASRWKTNSHVQAVSSKSNSHKVPVKVLRYFPLKPRLQRLFLSSETASYMRWHAEDRTKDGCLRHPADSPAWKTFDFIHEDFSSDPRNVRLGLAADGFNPFKTMSVSHSTWPVVLIPYNLPPWMCMKQPDMMLSLLIPGPSQPGNDIDVYLKPLIEELQELWEFGVETFDASLKENFKMRAAVLWTISDFPGYANLSGWSTKGALACPSCHKNTHSFFLKNGKKYCYMGHRRFLPSNHIFRRHKRSFDNTQDFRGKPKSLSGSEVLDELRGHEITYGKMSHTVSLPHGWKKRSIFFLLPYWKDNLLRHNLDVMHIEKNVCDNIIGTLLNLKGKSKDGLKARLDLKHLGLRPELHPLEHDHNRIYVPAACYSMNIKEREVFCEVLKKVKVPDGYAGNISRCVQLKQRKIMTFKSHDSHILMQQLLPLAIRRVLPKQVRSALIEFCSFFRQLCSKVCRPRDLSQLESRIASTLCQLERIFPPAFFDVMIHLTVHLASEVMIGGPVHFRWMYPIERFLCTLGSYVRNRNQPEGSIAEGYQAEECVTFCSRYLHGVETRLNRPVRNDDVVESLKGRSNIEGSSIFYRQGRPLDGGKTVTLQQNTLLKAHRYILNNCDIVAPFIERHIALLKNQHPRAKPHYIIWLHNETFQSWLSSQVREDHNSNNEEIADDLKYLARLPNNVGKKFKGYIINGFRFHTKEHEKKRKSQNSGVVVVAKTQSFASVKDKRPLDGDVTYYGVLKEIIELDYWIEKKITLFKCDWVSSGRGVKVDDFGFTLVNFSRQINENEPFIMASQAEQVFYVQDPIENDWSVVIKTTPRDFYNMTEENCAEDVESYLQSETYSVGLLDGAFSENDDNIGWVRSDVDGTIVDTPLASARNSNETFSNEGNGAFENTQDMDDTDWFDY